MTSLPNILTTSRIAIIPALVGAFWLPGSLADWIPLTLFVAASLTDWLDGYLARRYGLQSELGRFLDPVADKLLVAAAILLLVATDRIQGWSVLAALVILCREILVAGLREFLAELKVRVPVTGLAKWKTAVQMTAIGFLLANDSAPSWLNAPVIGVTGLWLAALLTLYTGYDYLLAGLKHFAPPKSPRKPRSSRAAKERLPATAEPTGPVG
jgi:cardiolipin synthase